ncbi:MAG: 3-oxoacid CoA-transferase subunit B [Ideonella sp.]|jgi:3-oxoadipate CoA-transferase beta subunit|nr:3-oxoacid CoA-transferase subunit B [Ideonella sp.]
MSSRWTKDQMARRVALDIADGMVVNLGIGLPTLVANHLPADREVMMHSENGVIGMGPAPAEGAEDHDLINAGKQPVTLRPGGCFFHHADSFAMMRGGHLDVCVLGAFQVSAAGDLANWHTGAPGAIPAVGGAMDLAIGARATWVMMEHVTKGGEPKIVSRCTYPLTGLGCVRRIYTDLAVIDVTPEGLHVREMADGLDFATLQACTGAPLRPPREGGALH